MRFRSANDSADSDPSTGDRRTTVLPRRSFLDIGRRSTENSSPETLAKGFVEEREQQKRPELQVIEVSTEARLVGRPAFRVRHSYRVLDFVGGARIEAVTIGTA